MSKPLPMLILTLALAVSAYAQSTSPSISQAQAVSTALQQPQPPQDDPIMKACEQCADRLKLAETQLSAVQQQLSDARSIIEEKDKIIAQQDRIIARYERIDTNSQQIDANSLKVEGLYRETINRADQRISTLESDLQSCQDNQKWIAGGSLLGGIFLGYKIHGAQQQFFPSGLFNIPQTVSLSAAREQFQIAEPLGAARIRSVEDAIKRAAAAGKK
jgi:TolA-binding protein